MTRDYGLCKNWYVLRKKTFQATPTKQDLGTSKGFFSKFTLSTPVHFIWEFPLWALYISPNHKVIIILVRSQELHLPTYLEHLDRRLTVKTFQKFDCVIISHDLRGNVRQYVSVISGYSVYSIYGGEEWGQWIAI